ncbi:hypothetical protein IL306_010625 [Fusarium sp. DS 682]|nr:hypothetical protein IL306_010625 [Fusarium sp. DS 682]
MATVRLHDADYDHEVAPLLASDVATLDITPQRKRRIVQLLCAFAFTLILGDDVPEHDHCQAQPIQKELALMRGFKQLVPLIPGLLCTAPYGLLVERIGRKRVLTLSGAGLFASLAWVMAVIYWMFVPIRWVLFSGVFLFVSGGNAVAWSVVHAMVNDVTERNERAQIFFYLHAADMISGFFWSAINAPLMEKGHRWIVLVLAESLTSHCHVNNSAVHPRNTAQGLV